MLIQNKKEAMLPAERACEVSKADALAMDAIFQRLAERGRRIRMQRKAINLDLSAGGINCNDGTARAPLSVVHNAHTSSTKPTLGG
jgi:hypothetical protein